MIEELVSTTPYHIACQEVLKGRGGFVQGPRLCFSVLEIMDGEFLMFGNPKVPKSKKHIDLFLSMAFEYGPDNLFF